ncbi:OmpA family protein [Reichenbachiella versicolor]|uniref:OmpA family protein n=1 Tax=Reichenbachiella versicolor TaxID=1821036 RepID=UPI000D6E70AD|nr:OmpA family protein [Reichenbachiella versicolor]
MRLILILLTISAVSCSTLKKADKSFENGDYSGAIYLYEKALNDEDSYAYYQLAEAYRSSNQLSKAEPFYKKAIEIGGVSDKAYFFYAQALKINGKTDSAKIILNNYLDQGGINGNVIIWAKRELENLDKLEELKKTKNYYRVKNLEDINTPFAEYSPVYNNAWLYFTSNRNGGKTYTGTGTPFTDIYRVQTKGANVNIETVRKMPSVINDPNINEGSVTLSKKGTTMIFAKANNGKSKGTDDVNIYYARYRKGEWSDPRPASCNEPDSWDSTPCLSPDGKTLYFSSNRDGGYGGLDIYRAKMNRRGQWVDIQNMGPEINTPGNELFPYAASTGDFYFSSDGLAGFGALDIFKATRAGGKMNVENLGAPFNSNADDFGIFLYNISRGFFSSNRAGGKGDDDIYTFVNDDPNLKIVNYYLSGTTYTPDENDSLVVLPNTKVILLDDKNEMVDEVFTGEDGKYRFRVYPEEHYYLLGQKDQYFSTRDEFSTKGKLVDKSTLTKQVNKVEFNKDLELDQIVIEKPIVMNNIYYDFNKANIKPQAAQELDKLVVVLKDNPEISIELSSHTDVRASHDYNMNLSQRRAQSAVDYIIAHGVDRRRIVARGYGETQLVIQNAQTEEEHQINRRTEFKVTKYDKEIHEQVKEEGFDETDRFFSDSNEFDDE